MSERGIPDMLKVEVNDQDKERDLLALNSHVYVKGTDSGGGGEVRAGGGFAAVN